MLLLMIIINKINIIKFINIISTINIISIHITSAIICTLWQNPVPTPISVRCNRNQFTPKVRAESAHRVAGRGIQVRAPVDRTNNTSVDRFQGRFGSNHSWSFSSQCVFNLIRSSFFKRTSNTIACPVNVTSCGEREPTSTLSVIVVEKPTVQVSASSPVQEYSASALAEPAEPLQPVQAVKDSMDEVDASSLAVTSEEPTSQLSPQEARESIPCSMTQSTLIRMEANAIAAHISQSMDASSQSITDGLEHAVFQPNKRSREFGHRDRQCSSPSGFADLKTQMHNASIKGRFLDGIVLLKQAS
jgi:hypothetical protein